MRARGARRTGRTAALIPNEPPESGGVRSRSRSPRRPSAAAATPCSVNGPWKFAQAVSLSGRLVPVADDAEALDRHAREPRDAERLAHDEIGPRERLVDVAVVERAVVDRCAPRGGRGRDRAARSRPPRARPRPRRGTGRARRRRRGARPRSVRCPRPRRNGYGRVDRRGERLREPDDVLSASARRSTPSTASAAVGSTVMFACASCERTIAACQACGIGSRSSMKRPSPRRSASSSTRSSERPTHIACSAATATEEHRTGDGSQPAREPPARGSEQLLGRSLPPSSARNASSTARGLRA